MEALKVDVDRGRVGSGGPCTTARRERPGAPFTLLTGRLIDELFRLEAALAVPDILFEEELREHHPHLVVLGLVSLSLTPVTIARAVRLGATHRRPSRNDLLALALALQEGCPLLSGDKDLRRGRRAGRR